jgi:hypothetical protein
MFFIPGSVLAIITFPGVIAHEVAHRFFCDLAGVPVYKVCYFQVDNNASGFVVHGPAPTLGSSFLIAIGPLIVNSLLCAVISFTPAIAQLLEPAHGPAVFGVLAWLGLSIGMHAFPSAQDAQNFIDAVDASGRSGLLYAVAKAFQLLVRAANALRFVWFDLLYAFGIMLLAPTLIALTAVR